MHVHVCVWKGVGARPRKSLPPLPQPPHTPCCLAPRRRRGWEPGEDEIEEATLVAQLLGELAAHQTPLQAAAQLQEAAYRLSSRWVGAAPH